MREINSLIFLTKKISHRNPETMTSQKVMEVSFLRRAGFIVKTENNSLPACDSV